MKNIDRLSKFVTKNGANSLMIHTVAGTKNWIVAQKIELDKWLVILCNPMGNITYNLGTVNDAQHLQLWNELTTLEIENKINQIETAKELKRKINNLLKNYEKTNKNTIKIKKKNTKQIRIELCKRIERFQESSKTGIL